MEEADSFLEQEDARILNEIDEEIKTAHDILNVTSAAKQISVNKFRTFLKGKGMRTVFEAMDRRTLLK